MWRIYVLFTDKNVFKILYSKPGEGAIKLVEIKIYSKNYHGVENG
jgi:hypothetical protein